MSSIETITVQGLECPMCGDKIWSRARHDYRHCSCEYCFVDGGRDYFRWGYGVHWANKKKQTALVNETLGAPKVVEIGVQVRRYTEAEQIAYRKRQLEHLLTMGAY